MRTIKHETALIRASTAASSLSVAVGLRSFYPYDYRPDSRLVPASFETAAQALRESLAESDISELTCQLPRSLYCQISLIQTSEWRPDLGNDFSASFFSTLAIHLNPASALAWNTHGVSLLRQGLLDCADDALLLSERLSRSHINLSRARANRAVLAELRGDFPRAEALAIEAALMPRPSPLALFNSQLYSKLMSEQSQGA